MAHNIARIDGTDQAWYADKPAWHGLGVVTAGARTAKQVVRAVPAFQQPVLLVPVAVRIGRRWVEDTDTKATLRRGQESPMAYVTNEYEKLTDEDALLTMEAVVTKAGERGRVKPGFGSAGLLGAKGARGFASIDLTRIFGKDLKVYRDPSRHESWLFGDWSHDGKAMHVGLWRNRVDCNNMLDMANAEATRNGLLARIVHKGDMRGQIREAQRILGLVEESVVANTKLLSEIAKISLPKPGKWMDGFVELVVPIEYGNDDKPVIGKRAIANRDAARADIKALWVNSKTLVGVPASPYRAYQAVAEYADHHRPLRIGGQVDPAVAADKRFRSITEGPAADLKARALELIRQEFEVTAPVPVPVR